MKFFGTIMLVMVVLFSIAGCGDLSGDDKTLISKNTGGDGQTESTISNQIQEATISDQFVNADTLPTQNPVDSTRPTETQEPTALDQLVNADISDEWIKIYKNKFSQYYTAEQYVALCEITTRLAAEPKEAVNSSLFFVTQNLSTYDKINKKAFLVNTDGEILREYVDTDEFSSVSIPYSFNVGKYSFVSTAVDNYSMQKDVFSFNGEFIGTYTIKATLSYAGTLSYTYDLGDDYWIFAPISKGHYSLYLLNPNGEVFEIDAKEWNNLPYNAYKDKWIIGELSDGVFSVFVDCYGKKYAYYFDSFGECVLDLSEDVFAYEVCQVSNFSNGQAEIEFVGVDKKNYRVQIDKSGNFISGPTLSETVNSQ